MYIKSTLKDGRLGVVVINRDARIIENLKVNMLIGIDIIGPEDLVVDVSNRRLNIISCGITVPVRVTSKGPQIQKQPVRI